mmetsp:Transcript_5533/g.9752  ORF Transcript_5533/g.9752 Transcript_5533/m.9752 type:complete len:162 (-) Transcript_5533:217-702(-)
MNRFSLGSVRASVRRFSSLNQDRSSTAKASVWKSFLNWSTKETPSPERYSMAWNKEMLLRCVVFGITGTTSVKVVRPGLNAIGLQGSMKEGPWSYRILSFVLVSPIYSVILLSTGSLAGRHRFFAKVVQRMWNRLLPKSLSSKISCAPAREIQRRQINDHQ